MMQAAPANQPLGPAPAPDPNPNPNPNPNPAPAPNPNPSPQPRWPAIQAATVNACRPYRPTPSQQSELAGVRPQYPVRPASGGVGPSLAAAFVRASMLPLGALHAEASSSPTNRCSRITNRQRKVHHVTEAVTPEAATPARTPCPPPPCPFPHRKFSLSPSPVLIPCSPDTCDMFWSHQLPGVPSSLGLYLSFVFNKHSF